MKINQKYKILIAVLVILLLGSNAYYISTLTAYESNSLEKVLTNTESNVDESEPGEPEQVSSVQFQKMLRKIAKNSIPAVVNIRTEKTVEVQRNLDPFFSDPLFQRFFGRGNNGTPKTEKYKSQALGTGFIITEDGYVITNNHVIDHADTITIHMNGSDKEYSAKLIGADKLTDVALIKIESNEKFPHIELGDSEQMKVGDIVVAIGNPFGLDGTFTMGVVSATGRSDNMNDSDAVYKNYIQTDASINQGNSGGPLINIYGQVIGVNTAIFSQSGGNIGIGFAIPINIVKKVAMSLKSSGTVERGFIGVGIQDVPDSVAKYYGLDSEKGALVEQVTDDGPADKAGIKKGDIIIQVGEEKIDDSSDLVRTISSLSQGTETDIKVMREGKTIDLKITIEKREIEGEANANAPESDSSKSEWFGMSFSSIDSFYPNARNSNVKGIVVSNLEKDSIAEKQGMQVGDIIQNINSQSIGSLSDFRTFKSKNDNLDKYLIQLIRNNRSVYILLKNE